jgi:hypothetical protein
MTSVYEYEDSVREFEATTKPVNIIIPQSVRPEDKIFLRISFNTYEVDRILKTRDTICREGLNMSSILGGDYGSDVEFVFMEDLKETGRFKAHKCILAARSEYFKKMFFENNWTEIGNEVIISDVPRDIFICFIFYLYGNRDLVEYGPDMMHELYICGDKYLQEDLCILLEPFLVKKMTLKTLMDDLHFSITYNLNNLKDFCIRVLVEDRIEGLESIITEETLKTLDTEVVRDILLRLNARTNRNVKDNTSEPAIKRRKI